MAQQNNKQLRRKVRASYFISTISIALVLFLLGAVGYLILNAFAATNRMQENFTVNVMLKDNATAEQKKTVEENLKVHQAVRKVDFISREQAAAEFKESIGTDFEKFLGMNPLPDSYKVGVKAASSSREALEAFEKELLGWKGVDEVVYQRAVADQISSNIRKFMLVLLVFGGTLFVISIILLRNTIRAAIYSKRYIITTMKLVGATKWFILKPFMLNSMLHGIYAAVISSAMFLAMVAGLQEGLPSMTLTLHNNQLAIIVGAMFLAGIFISVSFTTFAVNKFINMKTSNIHLY